jgi:hypothetical protein
METGEGKKNRRVTMAARMTNLLLNGEGVFEFFHPRFQILDLASLFFQEEVLDPVQACGKPVLYGIDVFSARHGALDHLGQGFDGGDVFV